LAGLVGISPREDLLGKEFYSPSNSLTCCLAFAVIWCILNSGGIQDGFAIAGTSIAYGTIMFGGIASYFSKVEMLKAELLSLIRRISSI
jgi:hypothetical protein